MEIANVIQEVFIKAEPVYCSPFTVSEGTVDLIDLLQCEKGRHDGISCSVAHTTDEPVVKLIAVLHDAVVEIDAPREVR